MAKNNTNFEPGFWPVLTEIWSPNFFPWNLHLLDIVASYHCMQFQGKVMNHTKLEKITKNLVSEFYLYHMLNIVASYHCMQFQRKLKKQT